jgi:hypothetical protein
MDDLETQLSAAAARFTERLATRRRSRRIVGIAAAIALVLGSAAIAQTTTFHPIGSFQGLLGAQRESTRADALPAAVRRKFARARIDGLQIDESRLMATFEGDVRLYAVPTRVADKLCLLLVLNAQDGAMTCGGELGPRVPLKALIIVARPGAGPVLAGLARDDVQALMLHAGGVTHTVPVQNGAFFYRGAPLTGIGRFTPVFR